MKMKRILALVLCLTLVLTSAAFLAGCGEESSEGGTLVWYVCADKPEGYDEILAKANAEYIEPAIGMTLDMQFIDTASFQQKLKLKMASNEAYDLTFTGYLNDYQTAVSMGALYDITKYIEDVNMTEAVPQFYLDSAMVDGKIYGVPNAQIIGNPPAIYITEEDVNKSGFDVEGLEQVATNAKTYEDVENYMNLLTENFAKLKAAVPNKYTTNPVRNLAMDIPYENVLGNLYIRRDGSDSTIYADYELPEFKLQVEKAYEWYTKGYIRSDIAAKSNAVSGNEEARQIAVRQDQWGPYSERSLEKTYNGPVAVSLVTNPYVGRTKALQTMISVGANSKHPKKAVEFIKLINSNADLYNLLIWGIEGVHYNLDEQGRVVVTELGGTSKVSNLGAGGWKFGNQFNSYPSSTQEADVYELTEKLNNEADKSPMLGFVPNTDFISNELANITNASAEFKARTLYGTDDPANWFDEYVQKMEQSGVQKVKEELQKQYDEFLKTK